MGFPRNHEMFPKRKENQDSVLNWIHANAYDSGSHGLGADSGPICSSMAAVPYLTGKVTYGLEILIPGITWNWKLRRLWSAFQQPIWKG